MPKNMILDAFKCSMYNNNKNTYMRNYFIQIPIFFIIKTNSSKEISPSPFESNSFTVDIFEINYCHPKIANT